MARILILTAAYGEGHNAAANALAAAFNDETPGTARVADAFALANPQLNERIRKIYLGAINQTPRLWRQLYALMDQPWFLSVCRPFMGAGAKKLAELIEEEQPVAICSSFPAYAKLLQEFRRKGRYAGPHFNIVTDSISINSVWWRPGCDGWFLPNLDTFEVMRAAGADPAKMHVTGFPVTPYFLRHQRTVVRPDLAAGAAPRILYIINSGTRNAEATARLLLAQSEWEVTCTVGRDELLRQTLLKLAAGRPRKAEILGWTDQIPHLLMSHHAVVSKAGGATTQEAVAARCPMIVNQVVPGQEEGNCELLLRHGAGALAETPAAVLETLKAAFANQAQGWNRWQDALAPMARPEAAQTIARQVWAYLGEPQAAEGSLAPTTR